VLAKYSLVAKRVREIDFGNYNFNPLPPSPRGKGQFLIIIELLLLLEFKLN